MTSPRNWTDHDTTHYAYIGVLVGGIAMIVGHVGSALNRTFEDLFSPVLVPATMVYLVSLFLVAFHRPEKCRRCTNQFPPDDAEAIARGPYRSRLRGYHRVFAVLGRPWLAILSAVAFGAASLLTPGPWVLAASVLLVFWTNLWCLRPHMQLRRWCPYCHGPDDGDEEQVPDPAPEGTTQGI